MRIGAPKKGMADCRIPSPDTVTARPGQICKYCGIRLSEVRDANSTKCLEHDGHSWVRVEVMTPDTEPTCEVCGAELAEETKKRYVQLVRKSSVRGAPVEEDRPGWLITRHFDCGSMVSDNSVEAICPLAHGMVMKLRRRVSELEVKLAARTAPMMPDVDPEYGESSCPPTP